MLQELLDEENIFGATSVARKLYEAAEVPIEQVPLGVSNVVAWVALFAEAIGDALKERIF